MGKSSKAEKAAAAAGPAAAAKSNADKKYEKKGKKVVAEAEAEPAAPVKVGLYLRFTWAMLHHGSDCVSGREEEVQEVQERAYTPSSTFREFK